MLTSLILKSRIGGHLAHCQTLLRVGVRLYNLVLFEICSTTDQSDTDYDCHICHICISSPSVFNCHIVNTVFPFTLLSPHHGTFLVVIILFNISNALLMDLRISTYLYQIIVMILMELLYKIVEDMVAC